MAQHQTWKGGIACKIQGHQEISRKESCLIMFAPFMRQALAINTIAFAELVQGLEGMEHEDMMRI